ncbi:nuclear pore complex protein nup107 [Colletotrichum truncatum]|uniref:Nuclear pore complex protein nup107 n=1 Tax=Colletotrichum truncatum TaxID=5467 RepID=A0ACC3Z5P0_COLTU|nr:nuclear pore complex protein nup107 [Colletotrichum truncatum]KAF6795300.1 nuclear pore complex protein nup107 [Colletotrichum truncatum]
MDVQIGPEFEVFANALDDCLSPHGTVEDKHARILGLVDTYYEYAGERLAHLRNQVRQGLVGDTEMDLDDDEDSEPAPSSEEIRGWEQERQTWDLIRRLIPLRYRLQSTAREQPSSNNFNASQQGDDLWRVFLEKDELAVERKTVLEWLQQGARTGPDIDDLVRELQQNADRGDIIAHGWIHTRSAIKLKKGVIGSARPLDVQFPEVARLLVNSDNAPLVAELDPDAVTRQGRKLEPQDEYFERAIWVGCFQLLRRGNSLETIRDWCLERTEVWRAVSMSALPLATEPGNPTLVDDPSALALWRRMCFALARQGGSDDIERAVYGLLAGDIPSVQKLCKTWDDFMFMHYNALIRTQFDTFVLGRCSSEAAASLRSSFPAFDAVQFHGDPMTLEQRLIKSLETNPHTRKEAIDPVKTLQAAIIAWDLERHFYEQGVAVTQKANTTEPSVLMPDDCCRNINVAQEKFADMHTPDRLRLAVHALIIFSALDRLGMSSSSATLSTEYDRRELQENVITVYISLLRLAGYEELIPLYCSRLLGPRAFQVLSTNILPITDRESRLVQLSLIRKAGLDVLKFVKMQPQLIFKSLEDEMTEDYLANKQLQIMESGPGSLKYGRSIKTDFFGEDPEFIDPSDDRLIRSVEWLLLVHEAWPDVFAVGVSVYKYFLKHMHLNAARSLASRVPFSAIMRQRVDFPDQEENDLWLEDMEFWASQIEPADATQLLPSRLASEARTLRELECLVKALDTMETIASLAELSREDPSVKRDFWTKVGNEVKSAKDYVRPLLKNWLLGQDDPELAVLRDTYLPETLLAYISVLHFAGTTLTRDNFLECMELAATIAEKGSDLAVCFIKANRMKELVEAFAACSKALAIASGEKKVAGSSNKKLREVGWSRDIWSVKP